MFTFRILPVIAFLLICTNVNAAEPAHPASGFTPLDLSRVYDGGQAFGSAYNFNGMVFAEKRANWTNLSQIEKYILAGVESSALRGNPGLKPWVNDIFYMASSFYKENGYFPERLTPSLIRTVPGATFYTPEYMDIFRNPFTNTWTELNPKTFTPGDVVIRPLTHDEMLHFASLNSHYKRVWFGGKTLNPTTGKEDGLASLSSRVFYIRIYGSNGPLLDGFKFIYNVE